MKPDIIIVSLGNGDPDLLNARTVSALAESETVILRTGKLPAVSWLAEKKIHFSTLDHLYTEAEDFDQLNEKISGFLIKKASEGSLVYAVPDVATDQTVKSLYRNKPENLHISIIPGISSYDLYMSTSIFSLGSSKLVVSSTADFLVASDYDPNCSLLLTELDNEIQAGDLKIFLSSYHDDFEEIQLLQGDNPPLQIPLYELDRQSGIDHQTAVLIPGTNFRNRSHYVIKDLETIMETLRSEKGCPWDRKQTHESLRPYLVEEAWECVAAIDQRDMDHLCEELGDLLFQIVFHSSVASSFDEFTLNDVVSLICEKMIRRHPHVFTENVCADLQQIAGSWEKIKRQETGNITFIQSLDDVSSGLPSLKYASKIFRKIDQLPTMHPDRDTLLSELKDTVDALRCSDDESAVPELERLFLLAVRMCSLMNFDSEILLHRAADHLKAKLKHAEKRMFRDGKSLEHLTFEDLCVYLKHVEDEIE